MQITSYKPEHLPEMAALFAENFKRLRASVPILPDAMESRDRVVEYLSGMFPEHCPGVVALDGGRVAGYMGWWLVDEFRGTDRKAAYCNEWAHAAAGDKKPGIYRAMYRAASGLWFDAGCETHALTLLAHDLQAVDTWFWNGFGLTGVDAIRPIDPLNVEASAGITIRKATVADVEMLAVLELEHEQHYLAPPVLMVVYEPQDAAALTTFLNEPSNSIWLALSGDEPVGYLRFEANSFGAATIVDASDKIACTGAFIRPQQRGRGVAASLLDAALKDYAAQGYRRCSVDFESFNPEAVAFWMKHFTPVCLSLIRVPERRVSGT